MAGCEYICLTQTGFLMEDPLPTVRKLIPVAE